MPRISSAAEASKSGWSQIYLGVAFTTLATLILELSLTRIFSVVFYYHFAFLAISIALFGLGAGGVFSYLVAAWPCNIYFKLGTIAFVNSLAVLGSLIYLLTRSGELSNGTLAAVYFASALPFFLSGTVVSMAVAETIKRVHRVYFFDLLGAAAGCLALVPLLNWFGGPNTVLAASVLFAVSSAIWYTLSGSMRGRVGAVALALGFVVLVVYNGKQHLIDIRYAKGRPLPHEQFVQWNSFSRIGLLKATNAPELYIDADASTGVAGFDLDHLTDHEKHELLYHGPGFPYLLRPGAKTLIIGPGGGWDVSRAIGSGSKDVTAVEINPIIANTVMRQKFADLSKRLYFRPEVHLFVEDGRSFIRRSTEKYQVLQATLVDTWAATAAGAFALSENNLYTTDAFRDYLQHLTDDGLMVFTRWGFDPPRESLRLISLAMAALEDLGETQPWKHVIIVREDANNLARWGALDTVVILRKPASGEDIARTRLAIEKEHGFQLVYVPGQKPANPFGELLRSNDPEEFWRKYAFDVSPVDDDRPFFFYTVQSGDVWKYVSSIQKAADYKINRAVPLLFELLFVSLIATIVVLALPPLLLRARLPSQKGQRGFLLYFVCLGAGYIMIQIALIQKFVLLLGHPTYALTVIIFSMLISSGLGSFYSRRFIHGPDRGRLSIALVAVACAVSVLAFVAAPISEFAVAWPLPVKMLLTVFLIAPAGFLMGMPFPSGLVRVEQRFPNAVRWAWSLNAAASVLGSVTAIFLAIYTGLRATVLVGAALYLCALVILWMQKETVEVAVPAAAEVAN